MSHTTERIITAVLAAAVIIVAILTSNAHGAEVYHAPNGACRTYAIGESPFRDALVVCTSNVPDMTGDGIPEQEIRILELRRYGRLECASFILFDPTCPTTGTCTRYLDVDRTCF